MLISRTVFDQVIERKQTASAKWDAVDQLFQGEDLLPMWVADMDFRAPQPVIDALKERVEHGVFGYPVHSPSVDAAVKHWVKRHYDWEIRESDIVYTSGVVPTISYIIEAFTAVGDEIVIQTPVYYPFYQLVNNNERTLVKNPLRFDGETYTMDLEHLSSVISEKAKMLILCNPHNPVGRVWRKEELEKIAELCVKHDLLLVSDEIHADLVFEGKKHIPIASLSAEVASRTFTCLAPSKTFNLAGLQTSYCVIRNDKYRARLQKYLKKRFMGMSNSFAELVTEVAYNQGDEWLLALRKYVWDNYLYVKDTLETSMPRLSVLEPEGTYLLWIDCSRLGLTASERKKWLVDEAKVAMNHGEIFGVEGQSFERMNIACPRVTVEEAMRRLKRAYDALTFDS
ncbi:pyridoxal phosphate-dependent aminotransferase [Halalkalibacterium halodurans]|uniref:cysteine-S-conjugate beta-lyase n=1 Tax=Halalkalibacterium halodurans TaxID=86665 RepID=A0A0M0KGL0_ALKHA|nr:MalY/PatB family protein [Halalkalibacterium halodurans]MED3648033.1 pyridoxal phosphate-dependent aminotransferase [Halalkalibacterium halodurans]MED4163059.1 pyridoxal phosphate-dependent aminotransferase [Halalkalibacterium halodurans]TPE68629.1 pyridoxal phosphate-dependent aminotransferase [Halalkalibacterium halodurans]